MWNLWFWKNIFNFSAVNVANHRKTWPVSSWIYDFLWHLTDDKSNKSWLFPRRLSCDPALYCLILSILNKYITLNQAQHTCICWVTNLTWSTQLPRTCRYINNAVEAPTDNIENLDSNIPNHIHRKQQLWWGNPIEVS